LTQTSSAKLRQPAPGSSARHSSYSAEPPASPATRQADTRQAQIVPFGSDGVRNRQTRTSVQIGGSRAASRAPTLCYRSVGKDRHDTITVLGCATYRGLRWYRMEEQCAGIEIVDGMVSPVCGL
jgi:hypothetical protein